MGENQQDINGDFNGQLANGNINNYHYQERERLSAAEVWPIKQKAKRLIELSGKERVEVWGPLKDIFGEGHNDLFKDQEKAAHAILDLWIEREERQVTYGAGQQADLLIQVSGLKAKLSEAQAGHAELQRLLNKAASDLQAWEAHANTIAAREQQARQQLAEAQQQLEQLRNARPQRPLCQTCTSATVKQAQARRRAWAAGAIATLAVAAALFLGYRLHTSTQSAQQTEAALKTRIAALQTGCDFGGKSYALGSIIDNRGTADIQCINDGSGGAATWQKLKSKTMAVPPKARPPEKASPRKHTQPEPIIAPDGTVLPGEVGKLLF